jgi:8-oxo-dGTP diphosphatase
MITNIKPKDFSPKFTSTGCYLMHEEKALFLKRDELDADETKWGTPGGTVDEGEFPKDATVREIFEETGISIDKEKLILVEKTYGIYPKFQFIYYIYRYVLDNKPKVILSKEHSEYKWLTAEKALEMDLILDEDYCIKKAFDI